MVSPGSTPRPDASRTGVGHQSLRTATAAAHARIDRLVDVAAAWSPDRYRGFLRAMQSVLAPVTPVLRRHFDPAEFPLLATAADRIAHDLAALGSCTAVPADGVSIDGEDGAWGAAYVVLGSHLGAPFIATAVRTALCLGPEHLTYLTPGLPAAPEWRRYLAALEAWYADADVIARTRCVAAAVAIVEAADDALRRERVR